MKYLFLVRSGVSDNSEKLINQLITPLSEIVGTSNSNVLIITSDKIPNIQSGKILSKGLKIYINPLVSEVLGCGPEDYSPMNILSLIDTYRESYETIILLPSDECIAKFPQYFSKFEMKKFSFSFLINPGEAWFCNCKTKTLTRVGKKLTKIGNTLDHPTPEEKEENDV